MKGSKSLNQHLSCKLGAYVIVHFCFLSFYEFTKNKSKGACRNIGIPDLVHSCVQKGMGILLLIANKACRCRMKPPSLAASDDMKIPGSRGGQGLRNISKTSS